MASTSSRAAITAGPSSKTRKRGRALGGRPMSARGISVLDRVERRHLRIERAGATEQLQAVRALAHGTHHGLALLSTGEIKAWGRNPFGGLGDGSAVERCAPVQALLPP